MEWGRSLPEIDWECLMWATTAKFYNRPAKLVPYKATLFIG